MIGGHQGPSSYSGGPPRGVERRVICACAGGLAAVAPRAELVARWTNVAREPVDAPANVMPPTRLTDRVVNCAHLDSEIVDPARGWIGVRWPPAVTS